MANELEVAEELSNSSPEQAMELLSSIGKTLFEKRYFIVTLLFFQKYFFLDSQSCHYRKVFFINEFFLHMSFGTVVKRDFEASDEEGMKMKEQAILSLGKMLSKHGKAEGEMIWIRAKLGMNLKV